MVDSLALGERRRSLRVPVRGVALLYASEGPVHGVIENISQGGALIALASHARPLDAFDAFDAELRLADGSGWATARTMRVEPAGKQQRIAVAFERTDAALREAIARAIEAARGAAARRPILVIDENSDRKRDLISRLSSKGMTPLAPRTPLEAMELLNRAQLYVGVCLLAESFGVPRSDLHAALSDSFPWLSLAEITDDLDATTHHALDTWNTTPIARLVGAA